MMLVFALDTGMCIMTGFGYYDICLGLATSYLIPIQRATVGLSSPRTMCHSPWGACVAVLVNHIVRRFTCQTSQVETGRTVGGHVVIQISFSGFLRDKSAPYSMCNRQGAGLVLLRALCARFDQAVDNSLEWGGAQLPNSPLWQILQRCSVLLRLHCHQLRLLPALPKFQI